ncbi:hypothetical protein [Archaeoglobus neptunius]|uniref:hypothetical protein n=1 Tax=Archaeoglobus neptunius TaxID=2798580 RepID=UPI0019262D44|nr:hypothetical protein [Archaeoglobus neptunius]
MSDAESKLGKKSRIREAMETVLKAFETNPEKVVLAVFKGNGKPSDSWSFFNRLIMFMNDTADARGFRQWQKVGRRVKKGAKAFYILAPVRKKVPVRVRKIVIVEEEEIEVDETVLVEKLVSFKSIPVFRYEDTEGEPLPEEKFDFEVPCEFQGIIDELGLRVETKSFKRFYGCYSIQSKVIRLLLQNSLSSCMNSAMQSTITFTVFMPVRFRCRRLLLSSVLPS